MKTALVTGPTEEPVSLQEVKDHLRVEHNEENGYLALLAQAARQRLEEETWRKFCTQTWDYCIDVFDTEIRLPWSPVQAITAITYLDVDGLTQTLADGTYELGERHGIGIVREAYNQTWPSVRDQADAIQVRYVVGYGAASAVPAPIRQAILILCAHLYEHREPVVTGMSVAKLPMSVEFLIAPYRMKELVGAD